MSISAVGPKTPAQTQASRQDRYVWVAEEVGSVVRLGELKIRSRPLAAGRVRRRCSCRAVETWGGTVNATELPNRAFQDDGLHRLTGSCDPRTRSLSRRVDQHDRPFSL